MLYLHRKLEGSAASGDICSVALLWWVILRPLTPWHYGLLAKASGRVACKCTGHPLACHCVIRQKIRPNSWDLRTVLPLIVWVMHCDVYTCKSPKTTGKKKNKLHFYEESAKETKFIKRKKMVKVLANCKEISSLTICLNTHLKHCFSIASSIAYILE